MTRRLPSDAGDAAAPETSSKKASGSGDKNKSTGKKSPTGKNGRKRVTLKAVAEHLGLSPATVSVVLNQSPVADSIPAETKERVFNAARELNYRPNHLARTLRGKRSFSVGVMVPEISEGYATGVLGGVETHLLKEGFFYLMVSHRSKPDLLEEYQRHLEDRSVEGFILVAAQLAKPPALPTVVVSGHQELDGVTNVVIDHNTAATLALSHLKQLGHRRIAFFRGAEKSVDADERWASIVDIAGRLDLEIRPELILQLVARSYGAVSTPEQGYQEGYSFGQRLLEQNRDPVTGKPTFSALFAFNDVSAIGAMRAFFDAGLRVPEDISVVGFDDILSAAFQNPSLTTVKQPLQEMGEIAAKALLRPLAGDQVPDVLTVQPHLVVRDSTGPPSASSLQQLAS